MLLVVGARLMRPAVRLVMMGSVAIGGFLWGAILSVLAAVVCRGGVLMRALGIAMVTRNGADASRGRILARAVVAWSWLPFGVIACAFLVPVLGVTVSLVLVVGVVIAVIVWSAITPATITTAKEKMNTTV